MSFSYQPLTRLVIIFTSSLHVNLFQIRSACQEPKLKMGRVCLIKGGGFYLEAIQKKFGCGSTLKCIGFLSLNLDYICPFCKVVVEEFIRTSFFPLASFVNLY